MTERETFTGKVDAIDNRGYQGVTFKFRTLDGKMIQGFAYGFLTEDIQIGYRLRLYGIMSDSRVLRVDALAVNPPEQFESNYDLAFKDLAPRKLAKTA